MLCFLSKVEKTDVYQWFSTGSQICSCWDAGQQVKIKKKLNANNNLRSEMEEKMVHTSFVDVQGCSFNQTLLYFHVNSQYLVKRLTLIQYFGLVFVACVRLVNNTNMFMSC